MEPPRHGTNRLTPDPTEANPDLLRLETALRTGRTRRGGERHAAVAIAILPQPDDLEVLLIRRTERADDPWSGQMAFPGGRWEPGDEDVRATAVREAGEEVGIDLASEGRCLGCLPAIRAVAKGRLLPLTITPVIFSLERGRPHPAPDPREVARTIWVSLGVLRSGARDTTVPWSARGRKILTLKGWKVDGEVIWGLTHRMLERLLKTLQR